RCRNCTRAGTRGPGGRTPGSARSSSRSTAAVAIALLRPDAGRAPEPHGPGRHDADVAAQITELRERRQRVLAVARVSRARLGDSTLAALAKLRDLCRDARERTRL